MKIQARPIVLVVFLLLIAPVALRAQIVIQQSQMQAVFAAGSPIRLNADTTSSHTTINVGKKGGPNTYDFSSLPFVLISADTMRAISVFPNLASRYPAGSIILTQPGDGQKLTRTALQFLNSSLVDPGEYRQYRPDSVIYNHSTPAEISLRFPITFGDSLQQTTTLTDSIFVSNTYISRSANTITSTVVVDGYGTLKLSGGFSQSCLRVRFKEQTPYTALEFRYITASGLWLNVSSNSSQPDTGVVQLKEVPLILYNSPITAVFVGMARPNNFTLRQNFPNPFNPTTTISFSLPTRSFVSLKVFDTLGREVSILLSEELSPGTYSRQWNAAGFPSSIYFYRLQAGPYVETKKTVLLR